MKPDFCLFFFFFRVWSNFNKLKTPDQWLWTCRQCWVHNTKKSRYRTGVLRLYHVLVLQRIPAEMDVSGSSRKGSSYFYLPVVFKFLCGPEIIKSILKRVNRGSSNKHHYVALHGWPCAQLPIVPNHNPNSNTSNHWPSAQVAVCIDSLRFFGNRLSINQSIIYLSQNTKSKHAKNKTIKDVKCFLFGQRRVVFLLKIKSVNIWRSDNNVDKIKVANGHDVYRTWRISNCYY